MMSTPLEGEGGLGAVPDVHPLSWTVVEHVTSSGPQACAQGLVLILRSDFNQLCLGTGLSPHTKYSTLSAGALQGMGIGPDMERNKDTM